jgi:hypothetical protein
MKHISSSSPNEDPHISADELHLIHRGKQGYEYEFLLPADGTASEYADDKRVEGSIDRLLNSRDRETGDSRAGSRARSEEGQRQSSRSVSTDILYDPSAVKKPTGEERSAARRNIPWKEFMTNRASLTLLLNAWSFGWIGFMLLSEIPAFLTDALGTLAFIHIIDTSR